MMHLSGRTFLPQMSRATLFGGGLAIAGLLLTSVHFGFLALAGVGIFGPGFLREAGWLRDQDEFQRRAAQRAAYHAFLLTGMLAFALYAYSRAGGTLAKAEELSLVYIACLCLTWMFSSLFSFWGPRTAAFRILVTFGIAWGIFNVLGDLQSPLGMLMQLLVTTAPFFVLAFASRKWPRLSGALLLAISLALLVWYFYPGHASRMPLLVKVSTAMLFLGPLAASGAVLVGPASRAWESEPTA